LLVAPRLGGAVGALIWKYLLETARPILLETKIPATIPREKSL
jgi:hypothetical protein